MRRFAVVALVGMALGACTGSPAPRTVPTTIAESPPPTSQTECDRLEKAYARYQPAENPASEDTRTDRDYLRDARNAQKVLDQANSAGCEWVADV